jgi:hypothetical protein
MRGNMIFLGTSGKEAFTFLVYLFIYMDLKAERRQQLELLRPFSCQLPSQRKADPKENKKGYCS